MRRLLTLALVAACAADATAQVSTKLKPAFPALSFANPVDIQAAPDGSGRLFVVEQVGTIRVFAEDEGAAAARVFLDLTGRVVRGGERGVLGLAFHPLFPDSNYVYVNYTAPGPLRTVVSRFTVPAATPDSADAASERVLLEVSQPFNNHNAGQLQFGPDGYLYVGMGDGGSGGDPLGHGQNLGTLLGAMLRLDVDGGGLPPDCGGTRATYTLPADNPFVGAAGACGEIYAYGFRNPWRYSFGPDGTLFVADVGQGAWEEVDTVTAGGNYGWNQLEGSRCYTTGCDPTGTLLPVAEYPHDETGGFSITGGYVYTGSEPGCAVLQGRYLYGDYVSGNIWSLDLSGAAPRVSTVVQSAGVSLSTFGVGASGVLYLADHSEGAIYRFDCDAITSAAVAPELPDAVRLGPTTPSPASGLVRFTVAAASAEHVEVAVYDALGRRVLTLFDGALTDGERPLTLDAAALPSGVYFIRARSRTHEARRSMLVLH